MDYDVIGDVHGHAEALTALLEKLGYSERAGAYRHPDRTAVFVGDFVDRGPEQVRSVMLARRMVDAGSALAVMGNHELNAIAWFLEDPDAPGEHLRRHRSAKHGDKNRRQHERFLAEVEARPALHEELVDWFLTLPLWLDLPELRVVHACWHETFMAYLAPRLSPGAMLTRSLMVPASRAPADEAERDTPTPSIFKAVDALTKGIEAPLPGGVTFRDEDGHERRRARVQWWNAYTDAKPVFFGHYWLTGSPAPLAPNAACVDYSVAKGGRLCAYRYDGEPVLDASRLVSVGPGGVP